MTKNQKASPFAKASGDSPSKLEERRRTKSNPSTTLRIDGERSRTIKNQIDKSKIKNCKRENWEKPTLEDVSGKIMAQPYIRFT